jgi:methionyl-tRNA formyltransferase
MPKLLRLLSLFFLQYVLLPSQKRKEKWAGAAISIASVLLIAVSIFTLHLSEMSYILTIVTGSAGLLLSAVSILLCRAIRSRRIRERESDPPYRISNTEAEGHEDRPRIVVMGYHNMGYWCLRELIRSGAHVVGLFTHRDDPAERIWFRSVASLGHAFGIPVYRPDDINEERVVETIRALSPDLILSLYFRQILSSRLLRIPPLGCVNLHGSLLPAYRGRCPVNWVLLKGEKKTGITLHYMTEKVDAGDIIDQLEIPIETQDDAFTLMEKLTFLAPELLLRNLPSIESGSAPRVAQDRCAASYFGGRRPSDGRIDWNRPCIEICNLVRAVAYPYPGAFSNLNGAECIVWKADCWNGAVNLQNESYTPGQITTVVNGGFLVRTLDGYIRITKLQMHSRRLLKGKMAEAFGHRHRGEIFEQGQDD